MVDPNEPDRGESDEDAGGRHPDGHGNANGALSPVAGVILGFVVWRLVPNGVALPVRLALVVFTVAAVVWVGIQLAARRR